MKKLYLLSLFFVISSFYVHAAIGYCYWDNVGWMGDDIYCYFWPDCRSDNYNVLKFEGSGDFYSKYRQMEKNEGSHPWDWTYVDGYHDALDAWNCKRDTRIIRFEGSIVSVPDVAFRLWPNVNKVELTESVQCIGYRSFMDCDRLPEVTFYGNTVGPDAFKGCDKLHTFTIDPKHGHVNIGKQAFSWAFSLRKIIIKSTDPNSVSLHPEAFYEAYGGITLCVPHAVLAAYTNNPPAHYNWWRIESIEYGLTLEEFETRFCGPHTNWYLGRDNGILEVTGKGPMFDFGSDFPCPWDDRKNEIREVIIEDGVTTVGQDAFRDADNLKEVTIAGSVKSIKVRAFFSCDNLNSITFVEGIENFGQLCFAGNLLLTSITLPSTTKSLEYRAFAYNSNLKKIICRASVPPEIHEQTFFDVDFGEAFLYVPVGSAFFYRLNTVWSNFKYILELSDEELYSSVGYELPVVYDTVKSNTPVGDTVRYNVYVHHQVNVYDTVHHQVLIYDTIGHGIYNKTVVYDTIYNAYKEWINDYDTVKIYVTDTVYTDTIYTQKYMEQDVTVYDTTVSYVFNWDDPDEVYRVIGKDEIIEIRRIDGSFFGYCAMNRMLKLSPGIYILRSFRTDNRLKIRVK